MLTAAVTGLPSCSVMLSVVAEPGGGIGGAGVDRAQQGGGEGGVGRCGIGGDAEDVAAKGQAVAGAVDRGPTLHVERERRGRRLPA